MPKAAWLARVRYRPVLGTRGDGSVTMVGAKRTLLWCVAN